MRQVKFSEGPFTDQYEDGHPPEKENEDERRRYRSGLPSKAELESSSVSSSEFEEAFQQWLSRKTEESTASSSEILSSIKNEKLLGSHLRIGEDNYDDSIPAADYNYMSIKAEDGISSTAKECFVIDLTAVSKTSVEPQSEKDERSDQNLLSLCGMRSSNEEDQEPVCGLCQSVPL